MLELLAPAGSMEALRAAVQNGANAVYLGVGTFNARQGAQNFTPQLLAEAVKYCHVRGVAVHLTLNTLVLGLRLAGVDTLLWQVQATLIAMPAASNTAILAEMYGRDHSFAAKCVFVSTVLSLITVPCLTLLF